MHYKREENRKDRLHKKKMKKLGIEISKSSKSGAKTFESDNIPAGFDKYLSLLDDIAEPEDVDDLPIPSWAKPIAKAFIERLLDKQLNNSDEKTGKSF